MAESAGFGASDASALLSLVIKNPSASSPGDFTLENVGSDWTVLQVKQRLHAVYPGNPEAYRQKLIVAGQVAKDPTILSDLFTNRDWSEPQVMHLVVSAAAPGSSPQAATLSSTAPPPASPSAALPKSPPLDHPGKTSRPSPSNLPSPGIAPAAAVPASSPSSSLRASPPTVSAHQSAAQAVTKLNSMEAPRIGGSQPGGTASPAGVQSTLSEAAAATSPGTRQPSAEPALPSAPASLSAQPAATPGLNDGQPQPQAVQAPGSNAVPAPTLQPSPEAQPAAAGAAGHPVPPGAAPFLGALPPLPPGLLGLPPGFTGFPAPAVLPGLSSSPLGFPPSLLSPNQLPGFPQGFFPLGLPPVFPSPFQAPGMPGLPQYPGFAFPFGPAADPFLGNFALHGFTEEQTNNAALQEPRPTAGAPVQGPQAPAAQRPFQPFQRALGGAAAAAGGGLPFMGGGAHPLPVNAAPAQAPGRVPWLRFRRAAGGQAEPQQAQAQQQPPQQQQNVQEQLVRERRIQVAVRIDLMLIFKLGLMVFLFGQDGSYQRIALLTAFAVFIYLYQTGVLSPLMKWLSDMTHGALGAPRVEAGQRAVPPQGPAPAAEAPPPAAAAGHGAAGPPAGDVGGPRRENAQALGGAGAGVPAGVAAAEPPQRGVLGRLLWEIQVFVLGFVTSLLPGFQPQGVHRHRQGVPREAQQQQQGQEHAHDD